ncbi:MAG: hypothetical protein HY875_02460 [Chloroflexi bacterium]|nr:hypothetical protein [Chloroflexota bacterium]
MRVQTKSPSIESGAFKHGTGRLILAVAGGAILLAGVAAAGVWAYHSGDSPSATVAPLAAVVPAASGAPVASPAGQSRRGETVYIVGSEAQAAGVMAGISEANVIRAVSGEPPFLDTVVVVASDAQAAEVMNAVVEGNRTLAARGEPERTVVDLRGS